MGCAPSQECATPSCGLGTPSIAALALWHRSNPRGRTGSSTAAKAPEISDEPDNIAEVLDRQECFSIDVSAATSTRDLGVNPGRKLRGQRRFPEAIGSSPRSLSR